MEHIPVLLEEVILGLNPKPNENFIDCTVGLGGHSGEVLRRISPQGKLLGFDRDPVALKRAEQNLREYQGRFDLINDNYKNINKYGQYTAVLENNGILCDLGISSLQISGSDQRGFSFKEPEGLLDMRMDPRAELTAADVLNTYREEELTRILKEYGEERHSKLIACRVADIRKKQKFEKISDLLNVINEVYKGKPKPKKIHLATRTFQALRIEVNGELDNLKEFLPIGVSLMQSGARMAIISFHSLEDRIVKNFFRQESKDCICPPEVPMCRCGHKKSLKRITKKPIVPSEEEIALNPRARSAKLRIAEKI
ncbi:16S rRNA (cytosine(1402)-N(4))-methyltransferase RsmH [Patescibacteria group bacterium]|nr:16S rRNA (cytosine(1402)-N(4))-methyltransferase RsmH [Patescibacteria group bacterium]MBU1672916.1 16S rRNA (cytosine(1402)-N(4))-methyltransferase RsmH [Patescibacteria group bacterium]MBU1963387.1 16S rRNA (cytosine(1402)-N(4))-methyltransferase RsmH [Patescibacteria group bacterium]